MQTSSIEINNAPSISKVLGAAILDIGLLGFFWFAGMLLLTALWTLSEYVSNAGTIPNTEPGPLALMLIGVLALYISIFILWAMRGRALSVKPTHATNKYSALLAISSGLFLCLLTMISTQGLNYLGLDMRPSNQALLEEAGKIAPLIIAFFTIIIAPVFEELFFRKQIFARFQKAGFTITGYLLSSLLFALLHEPLPTQGLARWSLMLLLYAAMGAVFAWVYQKTGKLWPAMLAHACNNLLAIGILFLA